MRVTGRRHRSRIVGAIALFVAGCAAANAAATERYVAQADVIGENGDRLQTSIRISIDRRTTAEERSALIEAVRSGGGEAARALLESQSDLGTIEIEGRRAMLKFAIADDVGGETMLTVATATPLGHVGSKRAGAEPVAGYDVAIATLYLDASGRGRGELSPAARIVVNASGVIAIDDYAERLVVLRSVERK